MLALDNSIDRIESTESDVLDLFESPPVPINLAGSRPEPRAAYVCAVKKNGKVQVYVVLAAEYGRNFVYTASGSGDSQKSYGDTLEEALSFARSMGFSPERVNLDYSPAMRVVVVRNFKIFAFPGSPKGAAKAPTPAHQKAPAADASPAAPSAPSAAPLTLASTASAASVTPAAAASVLSAASVAKAAAPLTKANDSNNQDAVTDVIVKFGNEMAALRAERDTLAAKVQELSAAQLGATAALKTAKTEKEKLVSERDKLAETATALEQTPSELSAARKELAQLAKERDEAKRRHEELIAENASLAGTVAGAKKELARALEEATGAREEAASAVREVAAAKEQATKATEQSTKATEQATRAAAQAAKAEEEAARAREEAAGAREESVSSKREAAIAKEDAARAAERAARAEEDAAKAQEEAAKAQEVAATAREEAAKTLDEIKKARDEAAKAKKESVKLAKERDLAARRVELKELAAEREKLLVPAISPVSPQASAAAAETAVDAEDAPITSDFKPCEAATPTFPEFSSDSFLLGEFDSFHIETATFPDLENEAAEAPEPAVDGMLERGTKPLEADPAKLPEVTPPSLTAAQAKVETMTAPGFASESFAGFGPADDSFFGSFADDSDASTVFVLRQDLSAVEYSSPEDILELQKSFNVANVSPDGKTQESCEGYVCCLRTEGQIKVFAVIHGMKSGTVGVYVPETQPADEQGVAASVAGAVSFHDQVGLMVESIPHFARQRAEIITNCPVLKAV